MTNNSGLQQLLIYINKNINAQLSFSFVWNNPRVMSWLLGAIAIKLNCSGKGSDCRKEGWSYGVEKSPVLLYFILVTDSNIRCREIAFTFLLRQRDGVSMCRSHTPENFPGSILLNKSWQPISISVQGQTPRWTIKSSLMSSGSSKQLLWKVTVLPLHNR